MEKQRVFGTNPVSDLTLIHRAAKHEVVYPILFKISSETQTLFCGPVDWTAEPGRVYVPDWVRSETFKGSGYHKFFSARYPFIPNSFTMFGESLPSKPRKSFFAQRMRGSLKFKSNLRKYR